jgi:hypothetical protein
MGLNAPKCEPAAHVLDLEVFRRAHLTTFPHSPILPVVPQKRKDA